MCSHYLVDPVACTPASGWEKGQVENQVGLVRERFFTPRLRVRRYEELNAQLLDRCVAHARAHRHPEQRERTIWEVFEAERPSLFVITSGAGGLSAETVYAFVPRDGGSRVVVTSQMSADALPGRIWFALFVVCRFHCSVCGR